MPEREIIEEQQDIVFISHIADEKIAAFWLKDKIQRMVGDKVEIFVASDRESIPSGSQWYTGIVQKLLNSKAIILLISPNSQTRPWINFEAGIALGTQRNLIIPVIYLGAETQTLSYPLGGLQGIYLKEPLDLRRIFKESTQKLGKTCPKWDWNALFLEFQTTIKPIMNHTLIVKSDNILSTDQFEFIRKSFDEMKSGSFSNPLPSSGLIILFSIPKLSSPTSLKINIQELYDTLLDIRLLTGGGGNQKLTIDGLLYFTPNSYALIYRSGIIEWVDGELLLPSEFRDNKKYVPMWDVEDHILLAIRSSLEFYKKHSIEPPIIYQIKLIHMRDYASPPNPEGDKYPLIEKNEIILPTIVVQNLNDDIESICQEGFEMLWNALGRRRPLRIRK